MAEEKEEDVRQRRPEERQGPLEALSLYPNSKTGEYPSLDISMGHDNAPFWVEC
jgi:hypothetical protein